MVIGHREKDAVYIDYGISVIRKKILDIIPKNTFYTTGQFFSNLIKKEQLLAFEAEKRFYHIGNPDALEEFRNFIRS